MLIPRLLITRLLRRRLLRGSLRLCRSLRCFARFLCSLARLLRNHLRRLRSLIRLSHLLRGLESLLGGLAGLRCFRPRLPALIGSRRILRLFGRLHRFIRRLSRRLGCGHSLLRSFLNALR